MEQNVVLNLWTFTVRPLGLIPRDRTSFTMSSASQSSNEREAVREIKTRFTPSWWEGNLITEVIYMGKLHMIEGRALYEDDCD